jgi:hypothetical protein
MGFNSGFKELNQRDEQTIRYNIQQNLFGGSFCSFSSTYKIFESFIE